MELIAELDPPSSKRYGVTSGNKTLRKTFVWGLDSSDTRNGAGGAMGLLLIRDHLTSQLYRPAYDLSGNLTGLLDDSGALQAWYEYGYDTET